MMATFQTVLTALRYSLKFDMLFLLLRGELKKMRKAYKPDL